MATTVDEVENEYIHNEMGGIETPFAKKTAPGQRMGDVEKLARRLSYEGKKKMAISDDEEEEQEVGDCDSSSEDEIQPLTGREKNITICDDKVEEEEEDTDQSEDEVTPIKSGPKRRRILIEPVDEEESEDEEPKRKTKRLKPPAADCDSESGIQSCSESDNDTNCKEYDSDVQEIDAEKSEQEDSEDEEGNLEEPQRNAADSEDDFVVDSEDDFVVDSVDDFVVDSEDDFVVDSEDDFVVDSEDDFVVDSEDEFVVNSEDDFDSDDDVVDSEEDFDSDDDDADSDGNSAADSGDDLTVNPPGEVSPVDLRDDAVDSRDDASDSHDDAVDSSDDAANYPGDDSAVDAGDDFTVLSGYEFAFDSGDDFDVDSGDDFEELTDDEKENIDENNNASKRSKNEPYPAKLMEHLRPMSYEKENQYKMMKEWKFDHMEELSTCSGVCPCGKKGIKRKCYIKNRVTRFLTHVGTVCIDLFNTNMKVIADVAQSLIKDGFVGKCQIRDPINKLVQVTMVREGTKIEKHTALIKKYFRKIPIVKRSGKTFVNLVKVPDSEMKKLKVGEDYRIWAEMCTNKDVLEIKMLKCKREARREFAHQNQFIWN